MNDVIIVELLKECEFAYAPYSNFQVAAAVVMKDGTRYLGVNIENASYGLTMCAERVAMYNAISAHACGKEMVALYVVTNQQQLIYPCGACLQVMKELLPKNCEIIIANAKERKRHTLQELYPYAFDKEDLHEF